MPKPRWWPVVGCAIALIGVLPATAAVGAVLPDERAYELVSPANKLGYQFGSNNLGGGGEVSVSPDGNLVSYSTVYPIPPSETGSLGGLLGERGHDAWVTMALLGSPGPNQTGNGFPAADAALRGSTPDQRASVYFDNTTYPHGSLWLVRSDGTRKRIADASVTPFDSTVGQFPGQPWFEGISGDGRHVVFADTDALVPGLAATGSEILYEWTDDGANGGAGTLRVVDRTNDAVLTRLGDQNATLGGSAVHDPFSGDRGQSARHAISADGARIFFQAPAPTADSTGVVQGGGPLYMRLLGTTTVELSAPEPGHTPTSAPTRIQYLDASYSQDDPSVDGRYVFFWADGDLTSDAPTSGGIYRYDTTASQLTFLAAAPAVGGNPPTAMASDDGSHLYFQDGSDVSVYRDGSTAPVLADATVQGTIPAAGGTLIAEGSGIHANRCTSAGVSPDGRSFAFSAAHGGSDGVYRYDAVTGVTTLVSTSPAAPPLVDAGFGEAGACFPSAGFPRQIEGRIMSDDGHYVFFTTAAPLVPDDNNGDYDTYEWHDGVVSLISSGIGNGSVLLGADASGANVFFSTSDALAVQDVDTVKDLYTARIGGGFPLSTAPTCEGDDCQAPPGVAPTGAPPVTATFNGRGNQRSAAPRHERFTLSAITRADRTRFARTGRIVVGARTTAAGAVKASLAVRLHGRWVVVARRARVLAHGGRVRLRLAISPRRWAQLQALRGPLAARIDVRYSRSATRKRVSFAFRSTARHATAGGR